MLRNSLFTRPSLRRFYHASYREAEHAKFVHKNLSKQLKDFRITQEGAIEINKNLNKLLKMQVLFHASGVLLEKICKEEKVLEKDYNYEVFEWIEFYRTLDLEEEAVYKKYDDFLDKLPLEVRERARYRCGNM